MYLSIVWTKAVAAALISLSLSEVSLANAIISSSAEKLFTKCDINSAQDRVSILSTAKEDFEKTVSSFDFDREEPTNPESNAINSQISLGSSFDALRLDSYDPNIKPVEKIPTTPPERNPFTSEEKKVELGYEKLQRLAIQRGKGYIVFEDGENDDHLQNYMAYLYDKRIPEMIVLHGGNAQLRYQCYQWVWKIMQKRTGCDIPEILIGGQGKDDLSVFDIVEGKGAIDEDTRQHLLANPMNTEDREAEAQKTYAKVANYISKLDKVNIGLKTAPTDLVQVVDLLDLLDPKLAREKMLIVWATPGSFTTKGVFELHAKFNYHRNYEASDKILASGIKTVMTGNGLSDTQARGFIDTAHAAEIRKTGPGPDNAYKDFEGFEGLRDLMANAKEGTFFHFYREVQHLFQKEKVNYGRKFLDYVVQPQKEMLRQVQEGLDTMVGLTVVKAEVGHDFVDDSLISRESIEKMLTEWYNDLQANKNTPEKLVSMGKQVKDLHDREEYLVKHWGPLLKKHPDLLEGCTADPHLELIFNAALRHVSIMEIIPVHVFRADKLRPQVLDVTIKEGSNTWIVSQIDATKFIGMFQDLINWEKKTTGQMPWKSFEYGTQREPLVLTAHPAEDDVEVSPE